MNPSLPWDQIHPQLQLQVMVSARPNVGNRSHSGHVVESTQAAAGSQPTVGKVVQPRLLC